MFYELIRTLLPTSLIILLIFYLTTIISDIKKISILKMTILGISTVIPAIVTMRLLGVAITLMIPGSLPILFYQMLSTLNEETWKYVSVKQFSNKKHRLISAIFIGGGFALCETLFLSIGYRETAILRAYTTLPLHIITTVMLSKSVDKKLFFLYALILHLLYNLILSI